MKGYLRLRKQTVRSLLDIAALAEAQVERLAKEPPDEHRDKWKSWCGNQRNKIKTLRRRLDQA